MKFKTMNTELRDNSHFPEDKDAPVSPENIFKKFYRNYKTPVDYLVFALISLATLVTISMSIYIITVKYL